MAYKQEKDGTVIINGFTSIATSPHQGIGNLQNVNVNTETGEVMTNFSRVQQSQSSVGTNAGTLTASSGMGSYYMSSNPSLQVGTWITISPGSTITGIDTTSGAGGGPNYYVTYKNNGLIQLASSYNGAAISNGTSGTATFSSTVTMGLPVASATESFYDAANVQQYRYYILYQTGY